MRSSLTRFARLAVTTVAATFVLIALGGFVRAMEAGLGCPDWPTCHGALNPPSELGYGALKLAWIEHSHRLWASVLIVLICIQAVAAWRSKQDRGLRLASYWLVPAVLSQAVLGAIVVWLKLDAESVTLHLAGALIVLALGLFVVHRVALRPVDGAVSAKVVRVARATAGVTFLQMLVGSTVTGYDAGLAFTTFPTFNGSFLPPATSLFRPWLHVTHRVLAYGVAVMVVALFLRTRRTPLARWTATATALVALQVALGAANVWFELSAWSVVPHLVVGAAIWAVLFLLVLRTRELEQEAPARQRSAPHPSANPAPVS